MMSWNTTNESIVEVKKDVVQAFIYFKQGCSLQFKNFVWIDKIEEYLTYVEERND
jgi:hypothetical protein